MGAGKQIAVVVGILGFTALFGGLNYGLRTWLGSAYVAPVCETACSTRNGTFQGIDYRMGKQDHESQCLCDSFQVHSPEADTVATASLALSLLVSLLAGGSLLAWQIKAARHRTAVLRDGP